MNILWTIFLILRHSYRRLKEDWLTLFLSLFLFNPLTLAEGHIKLSSKKNQIEIKSSKQYNNKLALDGNNLTVKKKFPTTTEQKQNDLQISSGLSMSQKAINDGSVSQSKIKSYSAQLELSYRINTTMSFKTSTSYDTYPDSPLQNDFDDLSMQLYFAKNKLGSNWQLSPFASLLMPLSKDSKDRQQMQSAIGGGSSISNQFPLIHNWNLTTSGSLSYRKYFHKFETATNGILNKAQTLNQQISFGFSKNKFSTTGMFRHINSWTYSNSTAENFFHSELVTWSFNPNFSTTLGHTNSGAVLSPNQEEINIRFIDENSSMIYISMDFIF